MSYTTTLAEIRSHKPCASGWRALVTALGAGYGDDTPLPLARIVETNGVSDALWAFRCVEGSRPIAVQFAKDCAARAKVYAAEAAARFAADAARFAADAAHAAEAAEAADVTAAHAADAAEAAANVAAERAEQKADLIKLLTEVKS